MGEESVFSQCEQRPRGRLRVLRRCELRRGRFSEDHGHPHGDLAGPGETLQASEQVQCLSWGAAYWGRAENKAPRGPLFPCPVPISTFPGPLHGWGAQHCRQLFLFCMALLSGGSQSQNLQERIRLGPWGNSESDQ